MTTYTVTIARDGSNVTYLEVTPETLKTLKKNYGKAVKAVKDVPTQFWYYRNTQVIIHEDRQNNRVIISSFDGTYNHHSVMEHELEYR